MGDIGPETSDVVNAEQLSYVSCGVVVYALACMHVAYSTVTHLSVKCEEEVVVVVWRGVIWGLTFVLR